MQVLVTQVLLRNWGTTLEDLGGNFHLRFIIPPVNNIQVLWNIHQYYAKMFFSGLRITRNTTNRNFENHYERPECNWWLSGNHWQFRDFGWNKIWVQEQIRGNSFDWECYQDHHNHNYYNNNYHHTSPNSRIQLLIEINNWQCFYLFCL